MALPPVEPAQAELFPRFSAATVAGVLLRQGIRNTYMTGLKPVFSAAAEMRVCGRARTLSYLPMREDQILPRERRREAPTSAPTRPWNRATCSFATNAGC